MIETNTAGVDCGTFGTGYMVKISGKYSMIPVLDDSKRVVGALFGPAWALPKDGVREFAEKVLKNQLEKDSDDGKVKACYFGWLCSYASIAYVTKDMGTAQSKASGRWSFMGSELPKEEVKDIQNIVMTYGTALNALFTKNPSNLKVVADGLISDKKGYRIGFIACTPDPLSR